MKGKIVEMWVKVELATRKKTMIYVLEYPDGSHKVFELPWEAVR